MIECAQCFAYLPETHFRAKGRPAKNGNTPVKQPCIGCRVTAKNRQGARLQYQKGMELRKIVLLHYGASCACCGEAEYDFLTLEHKLGDGHLDRKITPMKLYGRIIEQNFPDTYETLCMNCNWAKGRLGVCPHKRNS